MPLSNLDFRLACGHFATGVAVLTTASSEGVPYGMTINSFVSLSLEPPLVMAAIAHASSQLSAFQESGNFAINILSEGQRDVSTLFARVSDGRFENVTWELGVTGCPILAGTIGAIECRVSAQFDAGDHRLFIGEAVEARVGDGRPLLFFRSSYRAID